MSFGWYLKTKIELYNVDKQRIEENIREVEELQGDDEFNFDVDLIEGYKLELEDVEKKITVCLEANESFRDGNKRSK